ncbi:MAG: glycosyltransferase [Cellulomonadaceae bacterium]|nr:glycosyltransferase [Cellulomonadaceae bacterium]
MIPVPEFGHLATLTTPYGVFEHALGPVARPEHGFCLDDAARGLVLTAREVDPSPEVTWLTTTYLDVVLAAQAPTGQFHNRRDLEGGWTDSPGVGDHWGRALWALGTAAALTTDDAVRTRAIDASRTGLRWRSPWWHATAYAVLGAAELLTVRPGDQVSLDVLTDARATLGRPSSDPSWPWPDQRLTYADAVLPEALLAIASALDDADLMARGLALLEWTVDHHTIGDHLSLTPVGGWAPGEARPGFDQQPIEAAALAEACSRAWALTGARRWSHAVERCAAWFLGLNDTGAAVYDAATGGGFDGLERTGVNRNQGAESTLAALSTLQLARLMTLELAG